MKILKLVYIVFYVKVSRTDATPRWTKSLANQPKYHGWHEDGIKRFNKLFSSIVLHRKKEERKKAEELLMKDIVAFKYCKHDYDDITGEDLEESARGLEIEERSDEESVVDAMFDECDVIETG